MVRRLVRLVAALSFVLAGASLVGAGDRGAGAVLAADPGSEPGDGAPRVVLLKATGVVDQVLAGYLAEGIRKAGADGADAVVIQLNTPGGSLESTNDIVGSLLDAPLPTIVWVAPSGGRAASAGTFITLAAHLAYMAPGTNIGAASPVGGGGEDIEGTLGDKVRNDAIAKIRAIAEERGRNVEWAVATVEEAISSPASEALELGAIDGLAPTLESVLDQADGQLVRVITEEVPVRTAGAEVTELPMNPLQAFLHLLADPNIAFILFTIGFYGLFFELQNPNFVTGILGALALVLAFIGFGSLPLNVAGLLLIGFGLLLFFLETQVVSHGLLTVAGLVCFALGAAALYTEPGGDPVAPLVGVAPPLIVAVTITTTLLMGLVAVAAFRSRSMPPPVGLVGSASTIVGSAGVVRAPIEPLGSIYADGEEWSARAAGDRRLERGTPVRVVGQDGLTVIVEPAELTGDPATATSTDAGPSPFGGLTSAP